MRQAARRFVLGGVIGAAGGALGLIIGELAFISWAASTAESSDGACLELRSDSASDRPRDRRHGGAMAQSAAYSRRASRIFLSEPDDHLSSSLRTRNRDYHPGRSDRIFHWTGWRAAQARMADVVRSQSRNAREGREYPLIKGVTIIGRAEESDIGLFGDQSVLGSHAIIRARARISSSVRPAARYS